MSFFLLFNTLYILINVYIFFRGKQGIAQTKKSKIFYIILFLFFALSNPIGSLTGNVNSSIASFLTLIGSFWLAGMTYFFLTILLLDLIRLLNRFFNFFPKWIKSNYDKIKLYLAACLITIISVSLIYGYWNNRNPRVTSFEIYIPKKAKNIKSLNTVLISDTHYGKSNSIERIEMMADQINSLNPDLVLFAGDILDGNNPEYLNSRFSQCLKSIKSKFGIFGIVGNHDNLLNSERAREYFKSNGVIILRDSVAIIDSSFYLIGRKYVYNEDLSGKSRKSFHDLLQNVDTNKPLILLDHKPNILRQAAENNIDLQLSGHTHRGQLWPLNYITNIIYEVDWGYTQINKTQFYISCGYSLWGPPIRLGSYPEIVNIILRFDK